MAKTLPLYMPEPTEEDEEKRLLLQDALRTNTLWYHIATLPLPEPPTKTENFLYGLTFGRAGKPPETTGGHIASFLGEMTAFIPLDIMAGIGLGALGIRAGSTLGKIALEFTKGATVGATVSAITPEQDIHLPILYGVLGAGFGALLPRAFHGIKEVEEIVDSPEFARRVIDTVSHAQPEYISPSIRELVKFTPRELAQTPFDESLTKFIDVMNRYTERKQSLIKQASEEINRFIYGTDTDTAHLTAGIRQAFKEVDNAIQSFKRPLTNEEIKLLEESLTPNRLIDTPALRDYLNRKFLSGKLKVTTDKSVANFEEILKVSDKLNRRITRIQEAIELGISPTASASVIERRAKKVYDFITQKQKEIFEDGELTNLLVTGKQHLDDIINLRHTGTELPGEEIQKAISFIGEFIGKGNQTKRIEDALQTLLEAKDTQRIINERIERHIKRAFTTNPEIKDTVNRTINETLSGAIPSLNKLQRIRGDLLQYITAKLEQHIDEFLPPDLQTRREELLRKAITQQFGQADVDTAQALAGIRKQYVQRVLTDTAMVERIANIKNDNTLKLAYNLYRLSFGDMSAKTRLAYMIEGHEPDLGKYLAIKQMLLEEPELDIAKTSRMPDRATIPDTSGTPPSPPAPPVTPSGTGNIPPPDDVGKTIQQLMEASQNIRNDVGIAKYIRTPYLLLDSKAQRATGEYKTLYESARDWTERYYRARLSFLRDINTARDKLNEFTKLVYAKKETGMASIRLIEELDRIVTDGLEKKLPMREIEQQIQSVLAKQSPEVLEIRRKFREIADWVYERVNNAIDEYNLAVENGVLGGNKLPKLQYRPEWIPYLYEGDYFLYAKDSAGKIRFRDIIYVRDIAEGRETAVKRIQQFLAQHPNFKGTIHLKPRIITEPDDADIFGGFIRDFDSVFGVDATEIRKLIQEGKFTPDNVSRIFYGSALPRIFSWEERRLPVIEALSLNILSALRFKNFLPVVREGADIIKRANTLGLKGLARYVEEYNNHALGRAGTVERMIDDALRSIVDTAYKIPVVRQTLEAFDIRPEDRLFRNVINSLTFLNRLTTIGFNLGTAILNPLLFLTNVTPVIGWRNAIWALRNAPRIWIKRPQLLQELINESGTDLMVGVIGFKDIITQANLPRTYAIKMLNWVDRASMWLFNETEIATRGVTMLGAFKQAQQIAKKLSQGYAPTTWQEKLYKELAERMGVNISSKEAMKRYATHIMERTNFIYDATQLATLSRITPLRPFMQFKTFFMKELEFLFDLGKRSKTDLLKALGIFTAIGGLVSLPGINEIDSLSRLFFGFSPKEWAYLNLPEFVTAGAGTLWGIDLSTRAGIGDPSFMFRVDNIWSLGGAFPTKMQNALESYFRRGRPEQALRILTPSSITSFIDAIKLATGRNVTDPFSGDITMLTPQDMNLAKFVFRLAGFPTIEETKFNVIKKRVVSVLDKYERERTTAINKYVQALERHDFNRAMEIRKDYGLTSQQIEDALKRRGRTKAEYIRGLLPKRLRQELDENEINELLP